MRNILIVALALFVLAAGCGALVAGRSAIAIIESATARTDRSFYAASDAMAPAIVAKDRISTSSHIHDIKRGDVVVAKSPVAGVRYVMKRVVGLPGETIESVSGFVEVNGHGLVESYATPPTENLRRTVLGPNQYYLLGDKRPTSLDSRAYGPIDRSEIIGVAVRIVWPNKHAGRIKGSPR